MSYTLTFAVRHDYDTTLPGITVPVSLGFGAETIRLQAKVDSDLR